MFCTKTQRKAPLVNTYSHYLVYRIKLEYTFTLTG